jgi:raffinose/stachyose/melibiose transport system permease protein
MEKNREEIQPRKFIDLISKIFFNILVFIVAIPLIVFYVPIRFLVRLMTKKESTIYQGDNKFLKYLDENVLGQTKNAQNNRVFVYFLLPTMSTFILFVLIPFFTGIYYSFTDWKFSTSNLTWIGFANYKAIFSDYNFIYSFFRTIQYAFVSVIMINLFAFTMATLVTQKLKLKNIYRAGFFMPNLIGGLVLGYIWKFIYNAALPTIAGIFAPSLISDPSSAMGALIAVVIWQYAGYIMMIYIAALQNVPQDLIEASMIDGANRWQRLKAITLPLVAQAFTVSLFLTIVTSFKQFDTVFALTNGDPATLLPTFLQNWLNESPRSIRSLNLLAVDIYNTGYVNHDMAVGQTKAVVFFLFLLSVSVIQVTYNKRKEVEL